MKRPLTRTEAKVVRLVSLGCTTRQVGAILGISVKTADNHRTRAMQKLGVHTTAALTRTAIQQGVTSLSDRLNDEELARASFRPQFEALPQFGPPPAARGGEEESPNR